MNCQEFWNTMPEPAAIPHPHVAECPDCTARMRRQRELAGGLRAIAGNLEKLQAPPRVEARLLAAFREHSGVARRAPAGRRWIPAVTWAAAIAAMIAIGVLVVRDRQPEAQRPPSARAIELAVLDSTPGATESAAEQGFLRLPGAAEIEPSEDVNVVRVELPRSAMMQVGIDVSPERAAETVRAEVMVGSDGLARAVRFFEVTGSD
jgi:hypothetical protein